MYSPLNETRVIYDIEAYCDYKNVSDAGRVAIRKKYIRPILDEMKKWLLENRPSLVPDSPIGQAATYGFNHWDLMYHYLEDGKPYAISEKYARTFTNRSSVHALRGKRTATYLYCIQSE